MYHTVFQRLTFMLVLALGVEAFCLSTPSTSANALFLYRNSNFHKDDVNVTNPDQTPNGLDVQEAELQFYSDVDPYTRLSLLFSIAPKYKSDGAKVTEEWGSRRKKRSLNQTSFLTSRSKSENSKRPWVSTTCCTLTLFR